jgi:hypothetical protein
MKDVSVSHKPGSERSKLKEEQTPRSSVGQSSNKKIGKVNMNAEA